MACHEDDKLKDFPLLCTEFNASYTIPTGFTSTKPAVIPPRKADRKSFPFPVIPACRESFLKKDAGQAGMTECKILCWFSKAKKE
jgi:hypothetical protein